MDRSRKKHLELGDECRYIKGVGPARAQHLRRLGIETVDELITHFPRTYYDRRNLSKIGSLAPGGESTFVGQILTAAGRPTRRRRSIITAAVGDDTGIVQIVWFNQPYLAKVLKPGSEMIITGEMSYFRGARQVVNPEFEILGTALDQALLHTGRIVPVYPLTRGLSQRFMRELIARAIETYAPAVYENLPPSVIESEGLVTRIEALRGIHFPSEPEEFKRAVRRLKIEELFYLQLAFSLQFRADRRSPRHRAPN
ncbi:MAG: OB-fold nucleic acid binding domain-containing protein [bacterium]